jgi:predicted esterase
LKPHAGQPLITAGAAIEDSRAAMILVHGRNAGPANILSIAATLNRSDFAYLAPAAADGSWYPYSFMTEIAKNEPGLSSGLFVLDQLIHHIVARGMPRERILLLGFSQGACLSAEFAVRHAQRFGGLIIFSGGLIGPPGTRWDNPGSFHDTPVFLGCSDVDAHIPKDRVQESARVFERMGASVTLRVYPGMGHLVCDDEIAAAQGIMDGVLAMRRDA